jgi:hypothetical protein
MQAPIWVRAKAGVLVPVPRLRGAQAEYVNRSFDNEAFKRGEEDNEKLYPIDGDPAMFSPKTSGVEVFNEIKRAVRDGDLLVELKAPTPKADVNPFMAAASTPKPLQEPAYGQSNEPAPPVESGGHSSKRKG